MIEEKCDSCQSVRIESRRVFKNSPGVLKFGMAMLIGAVLCFGGGLALTILGPLQIYGALTDDPNPQLQEALRAEIPNATDAQLASVVTSLITDKKTPQEAAAQAELPEEAGNRIIAARAELAANTGVRFASFFVSGITMVFSALPIGILGFVMRRKKQVVHCTDCGHQQDAVQLP